MVSLVAQLYTHFETKIYRFVKYFLNIFKIAYALLFSEIHDEKVDMSEFKIKYNRIV